MNTGTNSQAPQIAHGHPQNVIADGEVALVQLTPNALTTDVEFDKALASSSFLPRVQLFGSNSNAVKEDKIGKGRYGLVRSKDSIEDLGPTMNCIPLDFRWKAMQITEAAIVSVYDFKSEAFEKLKTTADTVKDSGCMWGPEFLIWLPEQATFATLYLSSISSRREAKPIRSMIGFGCTLTAELIKKAKYVWHAPKSSKCLTALVAPNAAEMNEEIAKFRKAATAGKKVAAPGEDGDDQER
jgi:hypothetical protein